MNSLVLQKIRWVCKALLTNRALVRGLACVHLLMHSQVGQVFKKLSTVLAAMGPLCAVDTLVL